MIIVGYQGIGKSSLAERNVNFIDLESSNFFYLNNNEEIVRDANWYLPYCSIAERLSVQGYDVFISSHKEVRQALKDCAEHVIAIYPNVSLKDEWIEKLQVRYDATHSEKDYKALMNAKDRFEENIREISEDFSCKIEIQSIRYNLEQLIYNYQRRCGKPVKEVLYDERGVARYQRI